MRAQDGVMALMAAAVMLAAGLEPSLAQAQSPAVGDGPQFAKTGPKPARLADGHPNWTGFWTPPGGLLEIYRGPSGVTPGPGAAQGGPMPPFANHPPLKSPYKEEYAASLKQAATGKVLDATAVCFPPGMPRMMGGIYGLEILQTPGQITITSEWQAESRRIWMNEKTHPSPDELDPSYGGHSIGHWEGNTLVVDTVGMRKDVRLDAVGLPHSEKLHVVERMTQTSPGRLVDEITLDDPDVFVEPFKQVLSYDYRPDLKLEEYVCEENNRNVGPNGEAFFDKK